MASLFGGAIDRFVVDVESLRETLPAVMSVVEATGMQANDDLRVFIEKYSTASKKEDDGTTFTLSFESVERFHRVDRKRHRAQVARRMVPSSFLVSLVSAFDAYLGRLVRAMFEAQPAMINASDRQIEFTDLVKFPSIEAARAFIVEKEVESVLRLSHSEQFKWLETRLKVPLREGLEVWPAFIELTERRNLFVHVDGVICRVFFGPVEA